MRRSFLVIPLLVFINLICSQNFVPTNLRLYIQYPSQGDVDSQKLQLQISFDHDEHSLPSNSYVKCKCSAWRNRSKGDSQYLQQCNFEGNPLINFGEILGPDLPALPSFWFFSYLQFGPDDLDCYKCWCCITVQDSNPAIFHDGPWSVPGSLQLNPYQIKAMPEFFVCMKKTAGLSSNYSVNLISVEANNGPTVIRIFETETSSGPCYIQVVHEQKYGLAAIASYYHSKPFCVDAFAMWRYR